MLYAVVHVCVMNNILMIIITLHSIEKSSNNISPIYLNKSTDNSSSTRHPNRIYTIHKKSITISTQKENIFNKTIDTHYYHQQQTTRNHYSLTTTTTRTNTNNNVLFRRGMVPTYRIKKIFCNCITW